jgi:hypothetical protein
MGMAHLSILAFSAQFGVLSLDNDQDIQRYHDRYLEDINYAYTDLQFTKRRAKQAESFVDMERYRQQQQKGSHQAVTEQRLEGIWRQSPEHFATTATSRCSGSARLDMSIRGLVPCFSCLLLQPFLLP